MNDWMVIWSSVYPQDIYMAQGYLEANGVSTMLQDELTAQTSYYSNAVGGVKLLVPKKDGRRAAELLLEGGYVSEEDCDPGEEVELVEGGERGRCPFCGSRNVGRERDEDEWMDLPERLLGMVFPMFRRPWKCFDCGKVWKFKKG